MFSAGLLCWFGSGTMASLYFRYFLLFWWVCSGGEYRLVFIYGLVTIVSESIDPTLTKPGWMMCLISGGFWDLVLNSICDKWTIMSMPVTASRSSPATIHAGSFGFLCSDIYLWNLCHPAVKGKRNEKWNLSTNNISVDLSTTDVISVTMSVLRRRQQSDRWIYYQNLGK